MPRKSCSITGCTALARKRGWCNKHYQRWRLHGDPLRERQLRPPEERFWAKVEKTDTCWLWTAARSDTGYGSFAFRRDAIRNAHKVAYEMLIGPVPEGLQLDHLCRVRHCVNPAHLEPVTARENGRRGTGLQAIHAKKTHCIHGHEFTEENTYWRPDVHGRSCRTCKRERERQYASEGRYR